MLWEPSYNSTVLRTPGILLLSDKLQLMIVTFGDPNSSHNNLYKPFYGLIIKNVISDLFIVRYILYFICKSEHIMYSQSHLVGICLPTIYEYALTMVIKYHILVLLQFVC